MSAESDAAPPHGGLPDGGLPAEIAELIGVDQYPQTAAFPVEMAYAYNTLAATENANPLYWDPAVAEQLTGGMTMPATTLSLWMRPHRWSPGATAEQVALQVHFDLKARLGLPEAIMSDNSLILHEPVRPGDVISHRQVLRSVSDAKTTKLGTGRFWVIDVEYHNSGGALVGLESHTGFGYAAHASRPPDTAHSPAAAASAGGTQAKSRPAASPPADSSGDALGVLHHDVTATTVVLGAVASRDWRPMHHDYRFATERNGTRDIFMNAPNLAAWFERYITDWSGPRGRIGRMRFRIRDSIFPGDRMTIAGRLTGTTVDASGCKWCELDIRVSVDERLCCECSARVAVPVGPDDNPWARRGDAWKP